MSNKRNDPCHCGSGKKFKKCCGFQEITHKQLKDRMLKSGPLAAVRGLGQLSNRFFNPEAAQKLLSAKKITLSNTKALEGKK